MQASMAQPPPEPVCGGAQEGMWEGWASPRAGHTHKGLCRDPEGWKQSKLSIPEGPRSRETAGGGWGPGCARQQVGTHGSFREGTLDPAGPCGGQRSSEPPVSAPPGVLMPLCDRFPQ